MDTDKSNLLFLLAKGTALPNALIIPAAIGTADLWSLHTDPKIFPDKINGLKDREIGIPFTAPWTSNFSDCPQRAGGHLMGKSEIIFPQGCGTGNNGKEHSVLIPAPQAPQKPHAPPGTDLPLLFISTRLPFFRSISPPEFL